MANEKEQQQKQQQQQQEAALKAYYLQMGNKVRSGLYEQYVDSIQMFFEGAKFLLADKMRDEFIALFFPLYAILDQRRKGRVRDMAPPLFMFLFFYCSFGRGGGTTWCWSATENCIPLLLSG